MKLYLNDAFFINSSQGIDISIPLTDDINSVRAWYCDPIKIEPVRTKEFIGDVNSGGSVNFRNIKMNPHGNGTHTECVGHISKENFTLNKCLKEFHFICQVISVTPTLVINELDSKEDLLITQKEIQKSLNNLSKTEFLPKAIVIRTLPNDLIKNHINYSNSNPPFITKDAINYINELGFDHLLIDTPSVDRESDGGILAGHHEFWNYPDDPQLHKTISELIFVPDSVIDGTYLLNLQITSLENDASPSKPVLYQILKD